MAKKGKKRGPGGGRPQGAKRATPKPAPGRAEPATPGSQPKPNLANAGTAKNRVPKAQPAKAQGSKAQGSKAQRMEAVRRARRRKSLTVRLAVAGIVVVLAAFLVVRALNGRRESDAVRARLTAGSCDYDTRADRTDPAPRNHVSAPTYQVDPPAGGNHTPQAARPAAYGEGQAPTDGQVVHAMEHGDVVLWHRPELSPDDRSALQKVSDAYERDVLIVPRATLSTPVAATAWGRRLLCGSVDAAALDLFTRTYRDQGPEKLPE